LHEPVAALIASDEWLTWLHSLVQEGKIKQFGIAGEAPLIKAMLEHCPALAEVVQVRDSLNQRQADILLPTARPMQFTYGYLAGTQGGSADTLRQAQKHPDQYRDLIVRVSGLLGRVHRALRDRAGGDHQPHRAGDLRVNFKDQINWYGENQQTSMFLSSNF